MLRELVSPEKDVESPGAVVHPGHVSLRLAASQTSGRLGEKQQEGEEEL